MRLSPFQITLEVDSDTVNCADLHGLFNDIYGLKKGPVDFAVMQATANPGEPMYPQNGTIYPHVDCLLLTQAAVAVILQG